MKTTLTFLLSCALAAVTNAQPYTGRVFVDKNANGQYDKGEKLLSGVKVSDGLHVVRTQKDGTYSLPGYDKERFIFITTPSGYKTNNAFYRRIEPGKQTYDFGLQTTGNIARDGSHKFIQVADTEIFNTKDHEDWTHNVRDYAASEHAAFIMHTGDLCYDKGLKKHISLMNTDNMGCPVFYGIGNHDLVKGKYGEELYESIYGPVYYSFEMGRVHYVMTPMAGGDHAPSYTTDQVARWLRNDLAQIEPGTPVIIFNHNLLTTGDRFVYGKKEQLDLNEYNLKAWIYGHWHINYMRRQGKVFTISTSTLDKGGIDHSTSAFRVLSVDKKGDLTSHLHYTYQKPYVRIASISGGQAPMLASGSIPVSANLYSSVARPVKVTYACLSKEGKRLTSPKAMKQQTDWNWQAELVLPKDNREDELSLCVEATFSDGTTARDEQTFRLPAAPSVPQLTSDWTNFGGNPQHTGRATDTLSSPLSLAWVTNVGANIYMTSPLVYKGNIYVASLDENLTGESAVFALKGTDGSVLWRFPVTNSIKNSIAIADGKVFAQDVDGRLYAINASDGQLCWQKQLPVNGIPALIEGLVATETTVYAGSGKALCAIDARTGEERWRNTSWRQGEGTTSTWSVGQHNLVSGSQWNALYGNDLQTGKLVWKGSKNGLSNRGCAPAVHGNQLYLISAKAFFILDEATGKVLVRKDLDTNVDVTSTPLVTDSEIIFGTAEDGLMALDNQTLELKWTYKTRPALVFTSPYTRHPAATIETSPVLSGNNVFVGASDGGIYALDSRSGKLQWMHQTGAPVFSSVAVSGNSLIAADYSGNVYVFCTRP